MYIKKKIGCKIACVNEIKNDLSKYDIYFIPKGLYIV